MSLPAPPKINIYPLNRPIPDDNEFLKIHRQYYEADYPNGTRSLAFLHDIVLKKHIDAVVMICHTIISRTRCIYLRSAVRPAIANRFPNESNLWELPAGLIENNEDPVQTAIRETKEEVGFEVSPESVKQLGEFIFPTVGICSERITFFEVEVDYEKRAEPTLDGSPLEKYGIVECISLSSAMSLVRQSFFKDSKTELGIRRFNDKFGTFR